MLKLFLSTTNLRYDFGLTCLYHRPKGRCLTHEKGKKFNPSMLHCITKNIIILNQWTKNNIIFYIINVF